MNDRPVLRAILLAFAIVLAGGLVGRGLVTFRMAERYVSVKGVAERTVKADVGLWPLRWVATGDALDAAQRKVEADRRAVLAFLARHGMDSSHTELQRLEVVDTEANEYQQARAASRFIVRMTLMVRTSEPEKIRAASQDMRLLHAWPPSQAWPRSHPAPGNSSHRGRAMAATLGNRGVQNQALTPSAALAASLARGAREGALSEKSAPPSLE